MIEIDGFDTKILASLQDDAAVTNQQLGERIGLSASQVSRRRQRLEEACRTCPIHGYLDCDCDYGSHMRTGIGQDAPKL